MQQIPDDMLAQYEAALKTRAVPVSRHAEYRKWLRYYLVASGGHFLTLHLTLAKRETAPGTVSLIDVFYSDTRHALY